MNQIRLKTRIQRTLYSGLYRTQTALAALSLAALGWLLPASAVQANADGFYTGAYDYGGEAVHLYVEADQRGPETLNLRRLLNREHRIDTGDYILLAVVVDNRHATDSGFARLSVGGHKGPNVFTADFQTRLLAPADERRNWKLYLNRDASITGFTAILAPRAYSTYRGRDYGYYDRGYLDNSTFYGWIWRDRYYQHPRGHRFYNYRPNDRYFGRGYNRRYDRRYDRRFNSNRNGTRNGSRDRRRDQRQDRRQDHRDNGQQNSQQGQRPARPGFGDRDIYDHERNQRANRDQRLRGNHEYRGERRNSRDRVNRTHRNPERQAQRRTAPSGERARASQRQQARQQPRHQSRQQSRQLRQQRPQRSQQARAQRRPQLNKQRTTRSAGQVQQRERR